MDNEQFLDQMEKYYAQSDGVKDARPEVRRSLSPTSNTQHHYLNVMMAPVLHAYGVHLSLGSMLCWGCNFRAEHAQVS